MRQLQTQDDVFGLREPAEGEVVFFDRGKAKDRVSGLGLRIRAGGSRKFVFFYRYGGRQMKYTIGAAPDWSLSQARAKARELRVMLDNQQNPATLKAEAAKEAEAERLTLSAVVDQYLIRKAGKLKPRSLVEITRHLRQHWKPLHKLQLADITRAMVASRLGSIADDSGAITADRARSSLSTLFSWAIGEGFVEANPVILTNRHSVNKPRERVLTDAELVAIWRAAPDSDFGRIIKLLMLTGQRRDEIGGLRWSEVDGDKIALPGERTKNSLPHEVPLSDMALDVLGKQHRRMGRACVFGEGDGGFSGWAKAKRAIDAVAKIKPWRLHDLRRTAATRMADLGVQPHVIEAALNHVSGHKAGVAGIYNRATYSAEKRAALDLLANHLKVELATAEGGNIHKLKTRLTR